MTFEGPTLLLSSAVAAAVSVGVMKATRSLAKRQPGVDVVRLRLGIALFLFGALLISIAVLRITGT